MPLPRSKQKKIPLCELNRLSAFEFYNTPAREYEPELMLREPPPGLPCVVVSVRMLSNRILAFKRGLLPSYAAEAKAPLACGFV